MDQPAQLCWDWALAENICEIIREYDFTRAVGYGLGSGLGWMLAIVAIAGIRERLRFSNVPKQLGDVGIVMIVTGIMAMAFIGFAGMVSL